MLFDLRYALRNLRRSPGFAFVAILSLALGIGANTAVFSVANGILFRPVEAADPGRLVRVYRNHHSPLNYRDFAYFRDRNTVFSHIVGERMTPAGLSADGRNERLTVSMVSNDFWPAMGVRPALGTLFVGEHDRAPGTLQVAVLSHRYWQARFGGDSSVVGRTIRLNDRPFTVVGVAREGFTSSVVLWRPDVFVPLTEMETLTGSKIERMGGSLYTMARLKPGTSAAEAGAQMQTLTSQLVRAEPEEHQNFTVRLDHSRGVNAEARAPAYVVTGFLSVVVGLVLLLACANVANLLLARATQRQRELAVRVSIGAGRWRIVRLLLGESLLLAAAGGVLGSLLAVWAAGLIQALIPTGGEPVALSFRPDWRVLLYSVIVSGVTAVAFGLLPALRASRPDLVAGLKDEVSGRGSRRSRLRSALVVTQMSLCLVLLTGASLFLRSLMKAEVIEPGFEARAVVDLPLDVNLRQYDSTAGAEFFRRLVAEARALPGVRAAALAELVPLNGSNMETTLFLPGAEGAAEGRRPSAHFNKVGDGYFEALGIPIVRGRAFTPADRPGAPLAVVVNETMAARLWPNGTAVGARVGMSGPEGPMMEVVGVARDSKYLTIGESPRPYFYLPFAQHYGGQMVLQARVACPEAPRPCDLASTGAALRRAALALDPALPVDAPRPISEDMGFALVPARAGAALLGTFGLLALVLATVGVYGVTSYAVSQRTRELGIRSALGAQRGDVVRLILRENTTLVALGGAIGLLAAVGLGRAITALLYGVSPLDPATFLGAPAVLVLTALVASWVPARRASRVDPIVALRSE